MSQENRRYHIIIEQKVDIFIDVCQKYIEKYQLQKFVWIIKDEQNSVIGVGNPDKLLHSKDFGFSIYYETIIEDMNTAVDLFKLKLNHFIKLAKSTDKFPAFKHGKI